MPRKFLFTREEIIQAALTLTRERGLSSVTARALADALGTSTKPIFGLFQNMEEVHTEVMRAVAMLFRERTRREMESGEYPPYKASGMAYIRFAREEPVFFRLLFMRDRTGESQDDTAARAAIEPVIQLISANTGLSAEDAYRFHLEMWVFVHGIATMIATAYLEWDDAYISSAMTDIYTGLCSRFGTEHTPR